MIPAVGIEILRFFCKLFLRCFDLPVQTQQNINFSDQVLIPPWIQITILLMTGLGAYFLWLGDLLGAVFFVLGLHFLIHWMNYYFLYQNTILLKLLADIIVLIIQKM